MSFDVMYEKLIRIVRSRVANGDLTESHLARCAGISQPHMHNVLKGARVLSLNLADELLMQLQIDPGDLLSDSGVWDAPPFRSVPLLAGSLGPQMAEFHADRVSGHVFIPASIVASVHKPVAVRAGQDEDAAPRFEAGDLVLLDQDRLVRRRPDNDDLYVVMTGRGPRLRYVRLGESRVYAASEKTVRCPHRWEVLGPYRSNGDLCEAIRGRVVWFSRQLQPCELC